MSEKAICLDKDTEPSYCPYCKGNNVRSCHIGGLWTCLNPECGRDFWVYHRKPEPEPRRKGMTPAEVMAKRRKLSEL